MSLLGIPSQSGKVVLRLCPRWNLRFDWAYSQRGLQTIERRKLTSHPPNNPSHHNTVTMSASWKAAGLTYVLPTIFAPARRSAHSASTT